ncbi:MAG TPA: SurA N-terminal domain-containing protein, partial [Anaerolineaceae bacterium]|nr:SurA N-terminal domain-containing protein [Anaerolineaceae bacterium]
MARFTPPTNKSSKVEEPKPAHKEFSNKHLARVEREARQRKWLLGGLIAVGLAVIGFIGYGLLDQFVFKNMKPVAIVNGEKIKAEDLVKRTKYVRSQMGKQYEQYYQYYLMFAGDNTFASQIETYLTQLQTQLSPEYAPTITENVLDRMMEEILISQKAAEMGITVTEDEVDIALQDAFGYYPNGTPAPTATATEFVTPTFNP